MNKKPPTATTGGAVKVSGPQIAMLEALRQTWGLKYQQEAADMAIDVAAASLSPKDAAFFKDALQRRERSAASGGPASKPKHT